ncbi:MAG: hypothetical protein DRG78_11940, partial [Epsilonproteobacteria bacterium]
QLVELMGGRIWLESEIGVGSKFIFEIELDSKEDKRTYNMFSDKRVLIVDDNQSWHEILSNTLEMFDMQVQHAYDAREALEKISLAPVKYDLILMDWNMPEIDGIQASREIQGLCSTCNKKDICDNVTSPMIIMVSSFRHETLVKSARDAGIDLFLQKPINPSLLNDILSDLFLDKNSLHNYVEDTQKSLKDDIKLLAGSKILLVEDNGTNQEIILGLLENSGIDIGIANNGKEGVEKFIKDDYELILMDIQMPIMDGYEATKLIREIDSTIPIVALTANAMKEDIQRTQKAGMNEHLNKPIDVEKLYATLIKYVTKKITKPLKSVEVEMLDKFEIPEFVNIDSKIGLKHLLDNKKLYLKILNDFKDNYKDLSPVGLIPCGKLEAMDEDEFKRTIHTIKGLSANIGAIKLNKVSQKLDTTQSKEFYSEFYKELDSLLQELSFKLYTKNKSTNNFDKNEISKELRDKLFAELKVAVNTKQVKKCKPIIERLDTYILNKEDKTLFEDIKILIKKYKFKDAIELMEKV